MLRSNLSTRPFYNDRAVHVMIAAAALLVLALTAWNIVRIVTLSRQNTELSARINRDHEEADRLTREATIIRQGLDRKELQLVAAAAREANELIDQRTFSWTAFFNHIEDTLPPDVMLTSVQPVVRHGDTIITMGTLARRTEDIDEFVEKLEATGAFEDVLPIQGDRTEQNFEKVVLQGVYTGALAEPEDTASPATPTSPPSSAPGGARRGAPPVVPAPKSPGGRP